MFKPLLLSFLLCISTPIRAQIGQVVFASEKGEGLKRYPYSEELWEIVQRDNLDVWFRNGSIIDIYTPPSLPSPLSAPLVHPDKDTKASWNLTTLQNCTFHSSYHPLYEIDTFLVNLAETFPKYVKLLRLGYTSEGREMYGVRIRRKDKDKKGRRVKKGSAILLGAQHAREWIAPATALYIAHALVVPKNVPGSLMPLLDQFDFHIIPSPNPDGYEYTWGSDRFWYKNRQPLGPNRPCLGLDMNRNWGYKWSASGFGFDSAPTDTCSHWYPGSHPFESPEVSALATYISGLERKKVFVDLRSYGQMITMPFSYTCDSYPADAEFLLEASIGAAREMGRVNGIHVTTGSLCEMLYSAPGNVVDYMYTSQGIKYSYAIHLRDTGTYGYILPADRIRWSGAETGAAIKYIVEFVIRNRPL